MPIGLDVDTHTPYVFVMRRHSMVEASTGDAFKAKRWNCSMTLTTSEIITNEEEVRRDLIAVIFGEHIPLFGIAPRFIKSMAFNWSPSSSEYNEFGNDVKCVVVIGYVAEPYVMTPAEIQNRLTAIQDQGVLKNEDT